MRDRKILVWMFAGLIFMAGWVLGKATDRKEKNIIHSVAWAAVLGGPPGAEGGF